MLDKYIEENIDQELEIDFSDIFKRILNHWKPILISGVIAAVLGVVLSFGIPKQYVVVAKVAPELSLRTNSLTSLASMAGLNLNMLSNNNDALLPTVYPDIVASVPFISDLFTMPVNDSTLYYYLVNDTKHSWFGTVMSLPAKAVSGLVGLFKDESEEPDNTVVDTWHLTKEQNMVFKMLRKSIKVEVDKKTFLVTVMVNSQNPIVAADLSRLIIDNLKIYVTKYRTDKAQRNVEFLNLAYEEAKSEYYRTQQRYASYCDAHQAVTSQSSNVERQRLSNESNLKFQLYSSVAQQLQQAEVAVQQESPVFAEVMPPTVPLRKTKPSRMNFLIFFGLLGALSSAIYFLRHEK